MPDNLRVMELAACRSSTKWASFGTSFRRIADAHATKHAGQKIDLQDLQVGFY